MEYVNKYSHEGTSTKLTGLAGQLSLTFRDREDALTLQ